MLNREAVKNRINGLVKEYDNDGCSKNLSDAMAEILKAIEYHNMRPLTYEELLDCNGFPVWFETTKDWLKHDDECETIKGWRIFNVYHGKFIDLTQLGWTLDSSNYGKYWLCYERIL